MRTGDVIDHVDEKLDLVVEQDGSVRWKDEDELAAADAAGYLDAAEVRAEAERLLADPAVADRLGGLQPRPRRGRCPQLPEGWDVV